MRGGSTVPLVLFGLVALALCVRALGFEWVFVEDAVVFAPGDAQYHLRRSLYAFANFPTTLFWDSYINYPDGAAISWPPLFDFAVAAVGKVLARDAAAFQVLAAWASPVIGSLTLVPVYFLGREVGSRMVGLGAAGLLALLPLSVSYSRVGQLDHHCAVALIGACLLLVCTRLAAGTGPPAGLAAALAIGRIAMLLTWHGSLLYLGLVEATLVVAAAFTGRRELYAVQSASAAVTLLFVAPLVWLFPEPLGGPYSAIALSRLHMLAMLAVVIVSGALWLLEGRSVSSSGAPAAGLAGSPARRLAWTAALSVFVGAVLLALPGPRAGLEPALRFLTMTDGVGSVTGEQLPLFSILGRPTGRPAWEVWGGFAYAIPIAPLALLGSVPRAQRPAALVLAAWCAFFGAFAVVQRRYGNDLGPAAAVAFAAILGALARRATRGLRGRPWLAPTLALAAALALLTPPLYGHFWPLASRALLILRDGYPEADRALPTVAGSLTRFMAQVREVTPETAGYFDVSLTPEYGIVSHPNYGHMLQNVAHRATPTDPFWAFIGRTNWNAAVGLLTASSEEDATRLAADLRARYVMTSSAAAVGKLEGWLYWRDGLNTTGWAPSSRFRLVTEGPAGGMAQADSARSRRRGDGSRVAPYKLFEVVPGAVLAVRAPPGAVVEASLTLETPVRSTFVYGTRGRADDHGIARLRVPYSTEPRVGPAAVGARGRYRISESGREHHVDVTDAQVREGAVIDVPDRGE